MKGKLAKSKRNSQEEDNGNNVDIFSSLTNCDEEEAFEEEAVFISKQLQAKNRKKKRSGGFQSMGIASFLCQVKIFFLI
jgi:hypothetical protein